MPRKPARRSSRNGKPVPAYKKTLADFLAPTIESADRVRARIRDEMETTERRASTIGTPRDAWSRGIALREELRRQDERIADVRDLHARLVREAVVRGETVTKKVLADYPELVAERKTWAHKTIEYAYGIVSRPAAPGSVPRGRLRVEPSDEFRHGIVVYDAPLSEDDVARYELIPAGTTRRAAHNPPRKPKRRRKHARR